MAKGPPPGTHHAGTFKPGPDPRRNTDGPRPTGDMKRVRDHARQFTIEALDFLVGLMRDEGAAKVARIKAADSILDRGVGKPTVRVGDDDENPIGSGAARAALRALILQGLGLQVEAPAQEALPEPATAGQLEPHE